MVTRLPYHGTDLALTISQSSTAYIGVHSELTISTHSCAHFFISHQSEYGAHHNTEYINLTS